MRAWSSDLVALKERPYFGQSSEGVRGEQGRELADYGINEEIEKNWRHWASLAESPDSHGGKEREAIDGGIVSGMRV